MKDEKQKGNWWIWKVFWILLGLTTFEVCLGIELHEIAKKKITK